MDILISDDTWQIVQGSFDACAIQEITVKGREQPVMTHAVLGLRGEKPVST